MIKNLTLAVLACAALFALTTPVAAGPRCGQKGPIRQFIADNRPGILIPKQTAAPACFAAPTGPVTLTTPTVVAVSYQAAPSCPGGRCPLPR